MRHLRPVRRVSCDEQIRPTVLDQLRRVGDRQKGQTVPACAADLREPPASVEIAPRRQESTDTGTRLEFEREPVQQAKRCHQEAPGIGRERVGLGEGLVEGLDIPAGHLDAG